jgi:hypothetical protein
MSLSKTEIRNKLRSAVGKSVAFKYPGGHHKRGLLKDRVVVWSGPSPSGADYWDVVDLIEFSNEKHPIWIRIGYYRQVGDQLRWAGQTTITEPRHIMRRIFAQAANQKKWFRDLLPKT